MSSGLKFGSAAALFEALCYVCGFVMIATVLNPADSDGWTSVQKLEFILQHKTLFQAWNLLIYVAFGIVLVVLVAVLQSFMKKASPLLMTIATAFGMIWAGLVIASGMVASVGLDAISETYLKSPVEAAQAWHIISTVQDGLGGGIEVVGGLWVLLLSIVSLRSGKLFPKLLDLLGLIVGIAGLVTLVPALSNAGAIFGLVQIVWFAFLGVVLFRIAVAEQVTALDS